ncbi:MAG: hypothetical protein OEY23_13905 [Acidimicrobiia bacterium]|nr:hypothetical protein [Acidimicrobiia bacterium]
MSMTAGVDEAAFGRQEEIWAGLYGPARAAELLARARELAAADPARSLASIAGELDPEDEADYTDFAGMRPGPG